MFTLMVRAFISPLVYSLMTLVLCSWCALHVVVAHEWLVLFGSFTEPQTDTYVVKRGVLPASSIMDGY